MAEDNKSVDPKAAEAEPKGTEGKSEAKLASIFEGDDSKLNPEQRAFKNKVLGEYREKRQKEGEEMAQLKAKLEESEKWRETAAKTGIELKADKKEGLKLLDQLIDSAEPAAKENLRQIREIIKQETDVDKLKAELEEIKGTLGQYRNITQVQLASKTTDQLSKWKEDYGDDVIHRYDAKLRDALVRYPELQPSQVFKNVLTDEDYEIAVATKIEKRKKDDIERKKKAATPLSGEASSDEGPLERDKHGRVLVRPMLERALKGIVSAAK